MKQRVLAAIAAAGLAVCFVFGLAACGGGNDNNNENGGTTTTEHTLAEHKAKEPTCTENGNLAYWECTDCGKLFSDKNGKTETTLAAVTVAAKGHTLTKTDGKPATCKDEGVAEYWTCTVCKKLFSDGEGKTEITQADTVIPVTENHTYGDWKSDNNGHWKECEVCGKKTEKADHDFGSGLTCTECGYKYNPAEDTAPATLDELFPDETTATAVELARAEYYQKVAKENLLPLYEKILNRANAIAEIVTDYKWNFEQTSEGTIQNIQLAFNQTLDEDSVYMVYNAKLPTAITVTELLTDGYFETLDIPRSNISRRYMYGYDNTTQGDKDEFIKAVADKLDPDFDYTAPETMWLYTDIGTQLDNDYGQGRFFSVVLINNFGVRQFSIITPNIKDNELVSYIQKDEFKLNGKAEIDFSKYQINVDLAEQPAA